MKKYIIYNLKRFIPLYAVFFVVTFSIFLITFSFTNISTKEIIDSQTGEGIYYYLNNDLSSNIIILAIPLVVITFILPIFANNYRYSLRSADLFNQIGDNKKSIRFTNNLSILLSVIALYSVAFLFAIAILLIRQVSNILNPTVTESNVVTTYYFYNFAYYIPVYLFILIIGINNYFISYFFVTRANNALNSVIMLVLGHLILGIGLMTPFWIAQILFKNYGIINNLYLPATRTISAVGQIAFMYNMFDNLIISNNFTFGQMLQSTTNGDILSLIISIVCFVGFYAFGGFSLYYFFKEEESSGEFAGKPFGRDNFQRIIFYIGAGLISLWALIGESLPILIGASTDMLKSMKIVTIVASVGFVGAIYYVFLGLLRRNFRLGKVEMIVMASTLLTNVTMSIIVATSI